MSLGPQFKKIRKSQGKWRSGVSTNGASKASKSLFLLRNSVNKEVTNGNRSSNGISPPSASSTRVVRQRYSSSGSGFGSGPASPFADIPAANDNPFPDIPAANVNPFPDTPAANDNFEHRSPGSPTPGSTPDSVASSSNTKRNGRGATRGLNLDKIVEQVGKIKIKFNHLERIPARNEKLFSQGIGVVIRTSAELEEVSMWREVPEANKDLCCKRLLQWFEIEGWETPHVQSIVDQAFQVCYKNWRSTLSRVYRLLVAKGHNPRARCPREELTMDKWLAVCEWLESAYFQARSLTNSTNRKCLKYSHTSGKLRYTTRYRTMSEQFENNLTTLKPSKIRLWKNNHVDKTGKFVNRAAEEAYAKMVELEEAATQEDGTPMSKDQILESVLGYRSGYQKGMGGAVVVPRRNGFSSSSQQNSEIKDKLSETQSELEVAKDKIHYLATELSEQKEKNTSCENKIESLQKQLDEMRNLILRRG